MYNNVISTKPQVAWHYSHVNDKTNMTSAMVVIHTNDKGGATQHMDKIFTQVEFIIHK